MNKVNGSIGRGHEFSIKCTGDKYNKWEDGDIYYDKYLKTRVHKITRRKPARKVCATRNRIKSIRNNLKRRNGWSHFYMAANCVENENGDFYTTVTRIEDLPITLRIRKIQIKMI